MRSAVGTFLRSKLSVPYWQAQNALWWIRCARVRVRDWIFVRLHPQPLACFRCGSLEPVHFMYEGGELSLASCASADCEPGFLETYATVKVDELLAGKPELLHAYLESLNEDGDADQRREQAFVALQLLEALEGGQNPGPLQLH